MQGFVDRIPTVYAAADASAGFQERSVRDIATWKHSWGDVVPPMCYSKLDNAERFAMTLSLWNDLESVAAFAYTGPHAEALMRRKDWFQSLGLPSYVAWWVAEEHNVDWKEGSKRLDHLHVHGSSAFAFNFAKPYDAGGNSCRLDLCWFSVKWRVSARSISEHNAIFAWPVCTTQHSGGLGSG